MWRERDTPLKNRGMRTQTVQENRDRRHAPKEQRYEDTDGTGETETGETSLKNRGMRIQTVQEKQRQEKQTQEKQRQENRCSRHAP